MSLNRARTERPASEVAASAVLIGQAHLGAGALPAQGVVLRSRAGNVALGNHSAVLENGVLVGWPGQPVDLGQECRVVVGALGDGEYLDELGQVLVATARSRSPSATCVAT